MLSIFRSSLFGPCLIAIGIFLIVVGHKNASESAALTDHGVTAEAEIIKLEWDEKKITHNDSGYTAHVEFTTEDGRVMHESTHVTAALGRALRNKTAPLAMTIRYLPESPTTFRDIKEIDPTDTQGPVGWYAVLAGIILLALRFFFKKR